MGIISLINDINILGKFIPCVCYNKNFNSNEDNLKIKVNFILEKSMETYDNLINDTINQIDGLNSKIKELMRNKEKDSNILL